MQIRTYESPRGLSHAAADYVVDYVRCQPRCILALPTGSTPLGMYRELVQRAKNGSADFSQCTICQLDEYLSIPLNDGRNFFDWLQRVFISSVQVENTIRFNSMSSQPQIEAERVEQAIAAHGGIGLAILGLGTNGHLAFNEPGSAFDSRSRVVDLSMTTRECNKVYWGDTDVPKQGITLGLGTIVEAEQILLLVSGKSKGKILYETLCSPISRNVPATILRTRNRVLVIADRAAASMLTNG